MYIIGSIKSPKTGRKQAAHYCAMVLPLMTSSKFKPERVEIGNVPFGFEHSSKCVHTHM